MAFKYACYISYCHGQYDLVKGFIDQLKNALKAELDPLMDEEVYLDEERLKPGYRYNDQLASAICQSACMIVVYSPRYERHEYCVREFEGMEILEKRRLDLLGPMADGGRGFIIPIILRGDDLPGRIKDHKHYVDFSRFSLATPELMRHPEYATKIRQIATVIHEQFNAFEGTGSDPCAACQMHAGRLACAKFMPQRRVDRALPSEPASSTIGTRGVATRSGAAERSTPIKLPHTRGATHSCALDTGKLVSRAVSPHTDFADRSVWQRIGGDFAKLFEE